jgi:hypothetical protein
LFESEPQGAALRVDGVYQGAAPLAIFVPQGQRRIHFTLPGFSPVESDITVEGRVFGSLFFPKKLLIRESLVSPDPVKALALAASDYAAWAAVGEPSTIYQIPQSLSEGAYRAGPAAEDETIYRNMTGILEASARFAQNRAQIRDLLRAKFLVDHKGSSPSPLSLAATARDIVDYLSENPGAAFWLSETLYGGGVNPVSSSAWYKNQAASPREAEARPGEAGPGRALNLRGVEFRPVSGGVLTRPRPYKAETAISAFWIARREISREDWELFLKENPRWAAGERAALTAQGLVTEDYLITPPEEGGPSVSGVSWHAARAYCDWLNGSLSMTGYTVRLPAEAEWEYAARINRRAAPGIVEGMEGNHWEWCQGPYSYLDYLSPGAMELIDAPERPVRGGSWVNPAGTVGIETRGSLSPETCSPFVSFRPVIAPLEGPQ